MKGGDILLKNWRQDKFSIILSAATYQPPWWYWLDYIRGNRN